jgi:hypothetical protein
MWKKIWNVSARRAMSDETPKWAPMHLDTYKMSKTLERHDHTRVKASTLVEALHQIVQEALQKLFKERLTRVQQDKDDYIYRALFSTLKSELKVIEKNEVALIQKEHDRIAREMERTHQKLLEDVALLKSNITMEMNAHRETIRDMVTWTLQRRIYDVNNNLNVELSRIRIQMESIRLIVAGYLAAIVFAGGALFVSYKYYRSKYPEVELKSHHGEEEEANNINRE